MGQSADDSALGPRSLRPEPIAKETRATMQGKDAAFAQLSRRVEPRDGAQTQDRVAITDGAEPLQERMTACFPTFTLVLDVIHGLDYLWAASTAIYGPAMRDACRGYVAIQLELLLAGQTQAVIDDLTQFAARVGLPAAKREPVNDALRYFTRNAPFMRYDLDLAHGWLIASGVIDGACKHLVRDRMDRSGMRWSRSGAHAMLQLRALRINDDWDDYQRFRRSQEHLRLYGPSPQPAPPEAQFHDLAA
jgi:hypothetical protein